MTSLPPPKRYNLLQDSTFRARLSGSIGRRIGNAADVEDLVQETLLHTFVTAARHNATDPRQLEKIAQRIARNLIAQHRRQRVRKPEAYGLLDDVADTHADPDTLTTETKNYLRAVRPQLEPRLGSSQRALLAAYLDRRIVRFNSLARHLGTTRSHVGRMLSGIGKKILKLARRGPP